jgi:hypothetical protein
MRPPPVASIVVPWGCAPRTPLHRRSRGPKAPLRSGGARPWRAWLTIPGAVALGLPCPVAPAFAKAPAGKRRLPSFPPVRRSVSDGGLSAVASAKAEPRAQTNHRPAKRSDGLRGWCYSPAFIELGCLSGRSAAKPTPDCMQSLACETLPRPKSCATTDGSVCKRAPAFLRFRSSF